MKYFIFFVALYFVCTRTQSNLNTSSDVPRRHFLKRDDATQNVSLGSGHLPVEVLVSSVLEKDVLGEDETRGKACLKNLEKCKREGESFRPRHDACLEMSVLA